MKRWVIALAALAAAGYGGWRWTWNWLAERANRQIDAVIAGEAAKGRLWACADRRTTGFPSQLEITCESPTLALAQPNGERVLWRFQRVTASAQATRPTAARIEFVGPAKLERDGAVLATASWAFFEIGATGLPRLERASLLADDLRVEARDAPPVSAANLKLSFDLGSAAALGLPEGAARLGLTIGDLRAAPIERAIGAPTLNVETFGDLHRAMALTMRGTPAQRAEAWRQVGGFYDVKKLHVWSPSPGGPNLTGQGRLALDDEHRLSGEAALSATGLEAAARALGLSPQAMSLGGALGGLLGGAPKAAPAEPGALNLALRFEKGAVWMGPVRTPARLAPLY